MAGTASRDPFPVQHPTAEHDRPRLVMRTAPVIMKDQGGKGFTDFQKKFWGDGTGMAVPPNLGGERVVRTATKKKSAAVKVGKGGAKVAKVAAAGDSGGFSGRRALILGVLAQPIFYGIANNGRPLPGFLESNKVSKEEVLDSYLDGNAVTSPALEIDLLDLLDERGRLGVDPIRDQKAAEIVTTLEARGGTQLGAAKGQGRWVLPWVGGWERIWTSTSDAQYIGGPAEASFTKRGITLDQVSGRQFVYGPGEGGIVVEYLHAYKQDEKAPLKFLLTRPGTVTNLGDGICQYDFPTPLDEYEVAYEPTKSSDRLVDCKETLNADGSPTGVKQCFPLADAGKERGAPVDTLLVKTSCARHSRTDATRPW